MKIPRQLRVPPADFPSVPDLVTEVVKTVESAGLGGGPEGSLAPSPASSRAEEKELKLLSRAMIAIANQSWRMASAITDPETRDTKATLSPQELRKVSNALEAIQEAIDGLGIKIIDRVNETFDAGLPDQVITEEAREGLTREQIIRTIRPTIIWHQTMVQRGEIDIAVPASASPPSPSAPSS